MRLLAALLTLSAYSLGVSSQNNIVPNWSFEAYSVCPGGGNGTWIHFANHWMPSGSVCSPDYFNACAGFPSSSGVPQSHSGFQYARTGIAYAGFYAFSGSWSPNGREYIQVRLTEPIHAGVRYEVSFHVSLADSWWFGVGSLGAFFSQEQLVRTHYNEIPDVEPQIQSPEGFVFTDKEGWTEVRDTFDSRYGGEEYLILGNFRPDSESNITFVDSGATLGHQASYYFIDDVSVIALDSIPNSVANPSTSLGMTLEVYPNPATDMLNVRGRGLARLRLLDISGRETAPPILPQGEGNWRMDVSGLPAGVYLLEATDMEGRRAVERIMKMTGR